MISRHAFMNENRETVKSLIWVIICVLMCVLGIRLGTFTRTYLLRFLSWYVSSTYSVGFVKENVQEV